MLRVKPLITTASPVTAEAVGASQMEIANMDVEKVSGTQNLLAKMRSLLDELDAQSQPLAAAYVSQAVAVIEGQDAVDLGSRV